MLITRAAYVVTPGGMVYVIEIRRHFLSIEHADFADSAPPGGLLQPRSEERRSPDFFCGSATSPSFLASV
jgi:hypothetical protein